MENGDWLRRAEDLARRCARSGELCAGVFLSATERAILQKQFRGFEGCRLLFHGGHPACERRALFVLPDWMEEEAFPAEDYLCALRLTAFFGTPNHRDYLGALLGMGVGRERLGDIWVDETGATVFCMPGVCKHLLSIDKVGRVSVKAERVTLAGLIAPEQKFRPLSFSVQSPRLDAVTAGLFHLSRSEAARRVALGLVKVNDLPEDRPDYEVCAGDVISLRGAGKARICGEGGTSRKGRQFFNAEIYE